MPEGDFFNPATGGAIPAVFHSFGALLFCSTYLFLWRTSGVTYFGYWCLAWALESQSLLAGLASIFWLRDLLDVAFALALLKAAAAAGRSPSHRASNLARYVLPGLLLLVYAILWSLPAGSFRAGHSFVLAVVYAFSFFKIGLRRNRAPGIGTTLLRCSLVYLYLQSVAHVLVNFSPALDLVPQALLAFSAMVLWIEHQHETISQLRVAVETLENNPHGPSETDHLTGLQNRLALDRNLDVPFAGVVAVCDLDYFKDINYHFGHLVGDEVLCGIGHLIRSSIRSEDEAYRWGGDEFIILFRHQHLDLACGRMRVLEERLQTFSIRGHGPHSLGLSWGAAEGDQRILRAIIEEADHQMYERKRQTHARNL